MLAICLNINLLDFDLLTKACCKASIACVLNSFKVAKTFR